MAGPRPGGQGRGARRAARRTHSEYRCINYNMRGANGKLDEERPEEQGWERRHAGCRAAGRSVTCSPPRPLYPVSRSPSAGLLLEEAIIESLKAHAHANVRPRGRPMADGWWMDDSTKTGPGLGRARFDLKKDFFVAFEFATL
eukprot:scaffold2495_cov101-Isochrysis_galbana.AAC.22